MPNKNVSLFFKKLSHTQSKKKFLNSQVFFSKFNKKEINNLRQFVLKLFSINEKKKFINFNQLQNFLSKTKYYNLKRDLNTMVHLENYIIHLFRKKKILNNFVKGIEFPINIRIIHPKIPQNFKSKYNSSSIHCDPWAGEPDDLINVVIYLHVVANSSKINILNVNEGQIKTYIKMNNYYKNKFFLNSPKYFNELIKLKKIRHLKLKHQKGAYYIFNCFTPHYTCRTGKKIRLSLELRLRTINPYKLTKYWLSKTNRRGRYWNICKRNFETFDSKLSYELASLNKYRNAATLNFLRMEEVKRFLK